MASKTGHGRSGNTSNSAASRPWTRRSSVRSRVKGGQSVAPEDRTFSKEPRSWAAEAGRKGGQNVDSAASKLLEGIYELAAKAGRKGGQHSHGGGAAAEGRNRSDRGGNLAEEPERAAGSGRKRGQSSDGSHS